MDRRAIMNILPHRDAMLLLDTAELKDGEAHGSYAVRGDEFFLRGHFPGDPIVPGVILLEIMAQSACVLLEDKMTEGRTPVYTGLDSVRFRSKVRPGDTIDAFCRIVRARHPLYIAEGRIEVKGKLCASATFSFAIVGD